MAKLRRYTASPTNIGTRTARVEPTAFRARPPVFTGSNAAAIHRLGSAIGKASQLHDKANYNRAQMDDEIQYARATQKFQEAAAYEMDVITKTDMSSDEPVSQSDPDYYKTLTTFDTGVRDSMTAESIKNFNNKVGQLNYGFKTKAAQAKFEAFRIEAQGDYENAIKSTVNAKYADYQLANLKNLSSDAIQNGDPEMANYYVDVAKKYDLINEDGAERWRKDNNQEEIAFAVQSGVDQKEIYKQIDTMTKDATDRSELKRFAISEQNTKKAIDKQANEAATEGVKSQVHTVSQLPVDEFLAKVDDTKAFINGSELLTTDEKEEELKKINDRVEALAAGKPDPAEKIDVVAVRKIREKILKDPASVKQSDITGLNAPTWVTQDLEKLKASRESGDMPLPQKRGLQMLDRIRTLRRNYEDTEHEEGVEKQMFELTNDFINWSNSDAGKNATDEQVEAKLQSLTRPIAENVSLTLTQRMIANTGGRLGAWVGIPKALRPDTPKEQIADENIGELRKIGVWDELTEAEKADVHRGFMSGRTAQEFLDLYYAE